MQRNLFRAPTFSLSVSSFQSAYKDFSDRRTWYLDSTWIPTGYHPIPAVARKAIPTCLLT